MAFGPESDGRCCSWFVAVGATASAQERYRAEDARLEIGEQCEIAGLRPDVSDLTIEAATIDVGPFHRDTAQRQPRGGHLTARVLPTND